MWIENGNRQYVLASGMVEADSDSTKEYLDRPVRQILYEKIQGGAGARGYDGEILWKESVFDENLYLVHEVYRSPLSSDSLIVTSYDGVYDIQIDKEKASLNKILLPSSLRPRNLEKAGWISNFTPFVYPTVVSAVYSNEKNTTYTHPLQTAEFYASIEPLHGNILAVYSKESSTSSLPAASFTRSVIDKRDFEPYLISPSGELIAPKDRTRNHVYEHGGHDVIQMDFDVKQNHKMMRIFHE